MTDSMASQTTPLHVLTYLLGEPDSDSFHTKQRVDPPWFKPDLPALCSSSDPKHKSYTFVELKRDVKALGSGLQKAGFQDGDQLIVVANNSIYIPLLMLAT